MRRRRINKQDESVLIFDKLLDFIVKCEIVVGDRDCTIDFIETARDEEEDQVVRDFLDAALTFYVSVNPER